MVRKLFTSSKEREEAADKLCFKLKYVGFSDVSETHQVSEKAREEEAEWYVFNQGLFLTRLKR